MHDDLQGEESNSRTGWSVQDHRGETERHGFSCGPETGRCKALHMLGAGACGQLAL
jgi:hypothetical protein